MWQFVTLDPAAGTALPVPTGTPRRIAEVTHALTHRRYRFTVFQCIARQEGAPEPAADVPGPPRRWVTLDELSDYPLPRPHVKIAELLRMEG